MREQLCMQGKLEALPEPLRPQKATPSYQGLVISSDCLHSMNAIHRLDQRTSLLVLVAAMIGGVMICGSFMQQIAAGTAVIDDSRPLWRTCHGLRSVCSTGRRSGYRKCTTGRRTDRITCGIGSLMGIVDVAKEAAASQPQASIAPEELPSCLQ